MLDLSSKSCNIMINISFARIFLNISLIKIRIDSNLVKVQINSSFTNVIVDFNSEKKYKKITDLCIYQKS